MNGNHDSKNGRPKAKSCCHEEHEEHGEEKRHDEENSKHPLILLLRALRVLRG